MLEKEIREALKRFVESLVVLLMIPVMYVGDKLILKTGLDYRSLVDTAFVITLIFFAVSAGATVFQAERKDRAFEYLFSLPLGRGRIILSKVLPRLGLLLVLGAAAELAMSRGLPFELGATAVVTFFGSLFLSIGVFSIAINLFGVAILYLIFFEGAYLAGYVFIKLGLGFDGLLAVLAPKAASAAILLLPFGLAFWLTFKRMDARPLKLQMRTYYLIVLPTIVVLVSLLVAFFKATRVAA